MASFYSRVTQDEADRQIDRLIRAYTVLRKHFEYAKHEIGLKEFRQ